jgi:hypothetical protein
MKDYSQLRVPIAYDSDRCLVKPDEAIPQRSYHCASCLGEVKLKGTKRVRNHFFHIRPPNVCDFIEETEEHWRAKLRIVKTVKAGVPITFIRRCDSCRSDSVQTILTGGCDALKEFVLETGHRTDVAILTHDQRLILAIEILATHPVPADKAILMADIPWVEIHASHVLECHPTVPALYPIEPERSRFTCFTCVERKRFASERRFGGKCGQYVQCPLPGAGNVLAVEACARCEHFIGATGSGIRCLGRRALHEEP